MRETLAISWRGCKGGGREAHGGGGVMAREHRTTCEGCDFLERTERHFESSAQTIAVYECNHPHWQIHAEPIGPRPETPEWCPLEEKGGSNAN